MDQLNTTLLGTRLAWWVSENNPEASRGVLHWEAGDTENTSCVFAYGNDAYFGDDDVDRQARTRAYVHGLYVGWSNLLPEGGVEFGTTDDGGTWALVLHMPHGTAARHDVMMFLRELVWGLFHANNVALGNE